MQPGTRAVGVAESYKQDESTLAAAVVRRDRVVDGLGFARCTVGGTDATPAIGRLVADLDRPDARIVFVSGIALAWFNLVDLHALHHQLDRPVLSVSYEASPGLGSALTREFSGDALTKRRDIYDRQPPRRRVGIENEQVWVRAVGLDDDRAETLVREFTPTGGRPEPLRIARLAARAADEFGRTDS